MTREERARQSRRPWIRALQAERDRINGYQEPQPEEDADDDRFDNDEWARESERQYFMLGGR